MFDLRDNLGGLVQEEIETAELFLNEGETVIYTTGRDPENVKSIIAEIMPLNMMQPGTTSTHLVPPVTTISAASTFAYSGQVNGVAKTCKLSYLYIGFMLFFKMLHEKLMFGVLLKKLFQRDGVGTMVAKYAIGVHVENNTRTSFQQKQVARNSDFETQAYTSSRKNTQL